MAKKNNIKEEALELIWMKKEAGGATINELLKSQDPKITTDLLDKLAQEGYVIMGNDEIDFTEKGMETTTQLIRAHRLAERLFTDVLEIKDEFLESNACTFEHILSHEIITAICTLLGHPKECPHGWPIPQGDCCRQATKKIEKVIFPLSELKAGEKGKIIYITTKHHSRLDQLTILGIAPGKTVKIHQTFPAFVIKVGETDIALDTEVLKDIFARKM